MVTFEEKQAITIILCHQGWFFLNKENNPDSTHETVLVGIMSRENLVSLHIDIVTLTVFSI